MKNIIYTTLEGSVAVITPSQEALDIYGIQAIAIKDVPHGLAFKIVDTASLPTDYSFFGAWEADMSNPDGVGSESNEFPKVAA